MAKILMTGAGAPGAAGIINCLTQSNHEIFLCDCDEHAVGKYLTTAKFFKIPTAGSPDFLSAIVTICIENGIDLVLPLVTKELFVFSKQKEILADRGIRVLVSDDKALNIANDKAKLYNHLKERGFEHMLPEFVVVSNINELRQAVTYLGYPHRSICMKPSISNGSRGFRIITESNDDYEILFNHKPDNKYITLQKLEEILSGREFPELLISEYLTGEEYSVDCIVNRGKFKLGIPRLRKKILGGISVAGEFQHDVKIIEYSKTIVEDLHLHGNIGLQFRKSDIGEIKLLEINPRVQGTICAAMGLGINLPLLAVEMELNGKDPDVSPEQINWGKNFVRFWKEVYFNHER